MNQTKHGVEKFCIHKLSMQFMERDPSCLSMLTCPVSVSGQIWWKLNGLCTLSLIPERNFGQYFIEELNSNIIVCFSSFCRLLFVHRDLF